MILKKISHKTGQTKINNISVFLYIRNPEWNFLISPLFLPTKITKISEVEYRFFSQHHLKHCKLE